MEIRTKPLNTQQLEEELAFFVSFASDSVTSGVEVAYGWGCYLDIDSMWQYHPIQLHKVYDYFSRACSKGIVKLGHGDLFIRSSDFEFVLCHESDVHFIGLKAQLEKIGKRWFSLGYCPYVILPRVVT